MSSFTQHTLAQLEKALAAFEAHGLARVTKRDRAFISANMVDHRQIVEDGTHPLDVHAALAFHAYITARTKVAGRVEFEPFLDREIDGVRIVSENDGATYRAFAGERCLATATMRRPYATGPLWTLATSDGKPAGDCQHSVRLVLRAVASAYLAQLQAAEAEAAQAEAAAPSRISAAFAAHLASGKASAAWAEMDSAGRWAVWAKGEASHGSASCVGVFPGEDRAQAFAETLRHDDTARAAALNAAETFALAVRYEDRRNQDASEPNYSSETDLRACVTAALLAGWKFDRETAARNDWPWYVTGQSAIDNESAVKRNGEWRFYVETAAEALAEDLAPEPVAMVPQPVQQAQARDVRRGMARCDAPGSWQIGIYSVERDAAGCWVATATGPGTMGDGSRRRFGSLALAYHGVTGEPMPGHDGAGLRMVPPPVQQQQAKAGQRGGYRRVLPRDLFNEASLLKCLGALWIALDNLGGHAAVFETEDAAEFDICQDDADGSTYVINVRFSIRGASAHLSRPLNSRRPWPLYVSDLDAEAFESTAVFNDDGTLSAEFLALIGQSQK